ncbi:PapB/FocB family fimbrial expression transcriptional regulator [Escherichia coli]|uniref:PapB/FocB family fimbrial expression transcriptional regulator n=1 Tax=Escherichia coli TaxID=562 RepID=UPI000B802A06|nr:PapB/FocB family fimbrial expression transcriptional regulator [Escherichia coli]
MENNDELLQGRIKQGALVPGKITEDMFCLLVEMSSIRSEKMIQALQEYLVQGKSRIAICESYRLGSSHFSISLDRLQRLSYLAAMLSCYYQG